MKSAKELLENVSRIEPVRLEEAPEAIADVVADLSGAGAVLGSALHPMTAANLASLVRIMNTYYSNLIEGHDTRPRDIERALIGQLDQDQRRRNLQLEAAAHVRVQADVDRMAAAGTLPEPASLDFIRWLHCEFYRNAPQEMLRLRGDKTELMMAPGEWRSRPEHDVAIGRHLPPSSERVDAFMRYFENRYRFDPASVLNGYRRFLAWRKQHPALVSGDKILMDTPDPIYAFERRHANEQVLCVFNFSNAPATMKVADGWQPIAGHGFEATCDSQTISLPPFGVFLGTAV